jgi:hypothetical protein
MPAAVTGFRERIFAYHDVERIRGVKRDIGHAWHLRQKCASRLRGILAAAGTGILFCTGISHSGAP